MVKGGGLLQGGRDTGVKAEGGQSPWWEGDFSVGKGAGRRRVGFLQITPICEPIFFLGGGHEFYSVFLSLFLQEVTRFRHKSMSRPCSH